MTITPVTTANNSEISTKAPSTPLKSCLSQKPISKTWQRSIKFSPKTDVKVFLNPYKSDVYAITYDITSQEDLHPEASSSLLKKIGMWKEDVDQDPSFEEFKKLIREVQIAYRHRQNLTNKQQLPSKESLLAESENRQQLRTLLGVPTLTQKEKELNQLYEKIFGETIEATQEHLLSNGGFF